MERNSVLRLLAYISERVLEPPAAGVRNLGHLMSMEYLYLSKPGKVVNVSMTDLE